MSAAPRQALVTWKPGVYVVDYMPVVGETIQFDDLRLGIVRSPVDIPPDPKTRMTVFGFTVELIDGSGWRVVMKMEQLQ